jgi:hypothetical protein
MDRGPALLGTQGLLAGKSFTITMEGLRIGREVGNEVHIDDGGVSRQHARVLLHNGAVWVQDAGSRNGIFVNGERVPDHKQMKVGDQLTVGAHIFEVVPGASTTGPVVPPRAAPAQKPAAAPSAAPSAPKWKIWPFVLVILLVGSFIACIGLVGSGGDDGAASAAPAAGGSAYSLSTMLEPAPGTVVPPAGAGSVAAPVPATPTVADALAVVAGADPSASLANVPDAPPGTSSRELEELAQGMYDSGRLSEAKKQYQMALKIDAACAICKVRIERIEVELAAKVQQQFDAGMRYFDSMQFSQAVGAWETVLMLVPEPTDPMHVRAVEYLQKAKDASRGR